MVEIIGPWWIGILDVGIFFVIGYFFTRSVLRSFMIGIGFLLTQISFPRKIPDAYYEWAFEIVGLVLILIGCLYKKREVESGVSKKRGLSSRGN